MTGLRLPVLFLSATLGAAQAAAVAEADKQPYFESLKSDKVYMREGPGEDNPVEWVYHRKGLPVEVLASYDVWRRVRDMDGTIGWVHMALLSRERTALVTGTANAEARRYDTPDSPVVADVEPGAVGRLVSCEKTVCDVQFAAVEGWIDRSRLWGVNAGETF
jgi:SH3-like domain-containing protein